MRGEQREAAWMPEAGRPGSGHRPAAGNGPRWVTSLRALVVVLAMAAAAAGVLWLEQVGVSAAAGQLASEEPAKVAVPPLGGTTTPTGGPQANGSPGTGGKEAPAPTPRVAGGGPGDGAVVVHVAGAVKHPGVYTLPPGSRILQAVGAAGGALPTAVLDALNLAAAAADGTQIVVPTQAQVEAGTAGSGAAVTGTGVSGAAGPGPPPSGGASGPLNLNTASAEQLDALPGVGPVLAGRIVAWRSDHGPFRSVDELDAVPGIGAKMLANLRPLVSVK